MTHLSRRSFLAASAGLAVTAACGSASSARTPNITGGGAASSSGSSTGAGSNTGGPESNAGAYSTLVALFDSSSLRVGQPQRLVFGLGDRDGVVVKGGPATLPVSIIGPGGTALEGAVPAERHGGSIPRPYWSVERTFPTAGRYTARATIGGARLEQVFDVPGSSLVPASGDKLVAVDTPTAADHHGVVEVCTRQPACPLHEVTLTHALTENRPIALFIGTPAYCQTGVCGPTLELVLAEYRAVKDRIRFVHAEIYAQPYKDAATPFSPAVIAYNLTYEPALFLAGADSVIRERLDVLFDATELHAGIRAVLA